MNLLNENEVIQGERFEFGKNWLQFLAVLDEARILRAENSLRAMLDVSDLQGKRFLDIGSGSGLFSLAARRLGAVVYSFDYDPHSVAATKELKRRYCLDDKNWVIEQGSVLDPEFLKVIGKWDVVYSWGVLHHTGDMKSSFSNIIGLVSDGGSLFLAIYNDQGIWSKVWNVIKSIYNKAPCWLKPLYLWSIIIPNQSKLFVIACLKGKPSKYFANIKNYSETSTRGMSYWHDIVDWIGGYPFEVATPHMVFNFFKGNGFNLEKLVTWGGGASCNEYVFKKIK